MISELGYAFLNSVVRFVEHSNFAYKDIRVCCPGGLKLL